MSRIEINSGGHHVIVDHDGTDLAYVADKARDLWHDTKGEHKPPGPAYGFTVERDRGLDVSHSKRWGGEFRPVRVTETHE